MGNEVIGRVIDKSFRPAPLAPPIYWCYIMIDVPGEPRTTIHLHHSKVDEVAVGDWIRFTKPWWRGTVKDIEILSEEQYARIVGEQPAVVSIECSACHTQNRGTARFCEHCGSPLHTPSEQAVMTTARGQPTTLPEEMTTLVRTAPTPEIIPEEPSHDVQGGASRAGFAGFDGNGSERKDDPGVIHPDSIPPPLPPPPPNRRGGIVGEVRGFHERSEVDDAGKHWIIWSFHLQRFDKAGNQLPPVPVEMRGRSFSGFIRDGDRVEVRGRWREGKVLRVRKAKNLSMATKIVAKGRGIGRWIGLIVIVLIVFIILMFILSHL